MGLLYYMVKVCCLELEFAVSSLLTGKWKGVSNMSIRSIQLGPRRVLLHLFFVIEIGDVGYRSLAHRLASRVMLCVWDWLSTNFTLLLHAKATLDESSSGCPDGGMVDTRDLKSLDQ